MARTALTIQEIAVAGITPSYTAADNANGMSVGPNDGQIFLHVKNTGGGACTVTLKAGPYKQGGLGFADQTVSVGATTGDKMMGPFNTTVFTQTDGTIYVDFSTGTGVTVAALRARYPA